MRFEGVQLSFKTFLPTSLVYDFENCTKVADYELNRCEATYCLRTISWLHVYCEDSSEQQFLVFLRHYKGQ